MTSKLSSLVQSVETGPFESKPMIRSALFKLV
jgi:hypothetical protein